MTNSANPVLKPVTIEEGARIAEQHLDGPASREAVVEGDCAAYYPVMPEGLIIVGDGPPVFVHLPTGLVSGPSSSADVGWRDESTAKTVRF